MAVSVLALGPGLAVAQSGRWSGYGDSRGIVAPPQTVEIGRATDPRDPTGILRGQGISSRYGGIGNMGGGSGRSANTGVGLGGIGANQGARF
ncbi:hypothetical protein [Methylobacterium radiodurans]|uniref:hypothetical protein n=1 Tax=Methylobacterium radiodurans TaxID=2202828 RepID=UPI0013A5583E|nr:hypothetical protein [Methylobacterium radiodurans]